MSRVGKRKQRSDKKREVKPTLTIELKDAICRLAFITQTPVKSVAERMIAHGVSDRDIIASLSGSFRRDVRIGNMLHYGSYSDPRISKREQGECERITCRLVAHVYDNIAILAYGLDVSPTRVCALLLDASMRDFRFINAYVSRYLSGQLTEEQMRELRGILRYANDVENEEMTWASLLSSIVDEVSAPVTRVKEAVSEFIIRNWRDN